MDNKKHYDDFDLLAEMMEKESKKDTEGQERNSNDSDIRDEEESPLRPGKEKRKRKPAASREPGDFDSVSQFSIHLSRREHILLKTMSLISGRSVSRQIRDELAGYFNKVESWIRKEGVDMENLRKSFDKNFK